MKSATECRVIASDRTTAILEAGDEEACGLRQARLQGTYPPEVHLRSCKIDSIVRDGEPFEVAGQLFTGIQVRGHSQDSYCYLTNVDGKKSIFAGDSVFYGGVLGVINVEGSGMEGYRTDLPKLQGLGVEGFFPGHGLITLRAGQRHIDKAIEQSGRGFMPQQIGQGEAII